MPTVLLVRHGRTTANADGVLAGWSSGIELDSTGSAQVAALGARLAGIPLAAVVTSPLLRCQQTTEAILDQRKAEHRPTPTVDDRLGECHYGDWTGRSLKELAKEPLWRVVQAHPSAVTFPGEDGESLPTMQWRAVSAIREHDRAVEAEHGPDAIWVAVSHGDVIKAILADAMGLHLDSFQRLMVDTASVSVVRYTETRPFVVRTNDPGADLTSLVPENPRGPDHEAEASGESPNTDSDAVIGGETGASTRSSHSA